MTDKLTGGCQCGAIRYEISAPPVNCYVCHCTECQKQSASAFGMSVTVRRNALRITCGHLQTYRRPAESGADVSCDFCGACGTRLFHHKDTTPELMNVKAGTLDDRAGLVPTGHLWLKSAQPWMRALVPSDGSVLLFEGQAPDMGVLMQRWAGLRANL
jgi:hypothetical protein